MEREVREEFQRYKEENAVLLKYIKEKKAEDEEGKRFASEFLSDSVLITTPENKILLKDFFGYQIGMKISSKLLYRGTRDGFAANTFH
jgi:hypothetical protein